VGFTGGNEELIAAVSADPLAQFRQSKSEDLGEYPRMAVNAFSLAVLVFDGCMIISGRFNWLGYQFIAGFANGVAAFIIGAVFNLHRMPAQFTGQDAWPLAGALLWCWVGVVVVAALIWQNSVEFWKIEDERESERARSKWWENYQQNAAASCGPSAVKRCHQLSGGSHGE
jgi:hypothetical protein